jgi:hypothetical protein
MNETNVVLINTHDSINVRLSADEINDRAIQSVRTYGELEQAEQEFKEVQKDWKKRITAIEARHTNLRRIVETGEEYREVDCQRAYDPSRGMTWLVFEGKRYLERPCSPDELELARSGNLFDQPLEGDTKENQ